ncbi:MAG: hypothetical protein CFE39_15075 [Comamonadaceae bacterium PBBC2]|nr:MAG: hypothetical protein CFE39_15075 [Comamonadaceae bacterium PBBC2]
MTVFEVNFNKTSNSESPMSQNAACQHAPKRWIPSAPSWILGGLAVCALWLGGFSAVQAQEKTAGRQIEALGELYDLQNKAVTDAQSRIIFYRPINAKQGGAATVFINGRYHASLVPGAYSPVCVKPGPVNLSVRWMEVHRRANKDGFDSITELPLASGKNHVIRVNDERGKTLELAPVKPADAAQELNATRLQLHTISRVNAVDCVDVAAAETPVGMPPKPPRRLQLAGDTLFAFNRGDAAGLTSQGLRAIDLLMAQIESEFSRVERIHVMGHTDPFGTMELNEKLSAQRAKTVADYIASRGRFSGTVTSEGRGKRDLVVTTCGHELTQTNIDCNQPNRRVSVEVTGVNREP